jgi:hypothetical protein
MFAEAEQRIAGDVIAAVDNRTPYDFAASHRGAALSLVAASSRFDEAGDEPDPHAPLKFARIEAEPRERNSGSTKRSPFGSVATFVQARQTHEGSSHLRGVLPYSKAVFRRNQ